MCFPTLTRRYLFMRYVFSQMVLVAGLLYMGSGLLDAQSQDYINATNSAEIANLKRQVDAIDNRMWFVLMGVASSLVAQVINIRQNWKNGNGK